jgi:hypothetical protein
MRPIRPDDAPALAPLYVRLSLRFTPRVDRPGRQASPASEAGR